MSLHKSITLGLLLYSAAVNTYTDIQEDRDLTGCSVQLKGSVFNLQDLIRDSNQTLTGEDLDATDYRVFYTRPGANGISEKVSLNFNICEATNRDCSNEESNEDDFANIKINSKCKHLSDSALSEVDVNLIDDKDPSKGLILSYTGGDKCNDTTDYRLDIVLLCNETVDEPIYALQNSVIKTTAEECEPKKINFQTSEACPKISLGALWEFLNKFYYLFGMVMIIFGAYLVSFGNKYQDHTLFFLGMTAFATFFLILMYVAVIPIQSETWLMVVMFLAAFALGSIVGIGMKKFGRSGMIVTGAWIGGVLGCMSYSAVLRLITIETYPLLLLWLTIIVYAGIAGYLANKYFDVAIIFGSSIVGSFLFFRVSLIIFFTSVQGISEFTGGYPNEFLLYQKIQGNGSVPISMYWYMVGMAVLFILSAFYQWHARDKGSLGSLYYMVTFGRSQVDKYKKVPKHDHKDDEDKEQ